MVPGPKGLRKVGKIKTPAYASFQNAPRNATLWVPYPESTPQMTPENIE